MIGESGAVFFVPTLCLVRYARPDDEAEAERPKKHSPPEPGNEKMRERTMPTLPDQFVQRFVRKEMRDRVAHEWEKKPDKLHYRICDQADEVFADNFRGGHADFGGDEVVLALSGSRTQEVRFFEAERYLGCGDGVLIVAADGSRFLAETESGTHRPYEMYGGSE